MSLPRSRASLLPGRPTLALQLCVSASLRDPLRPKPALILLGLLLALVTATGCGPQQIDPLPDGWPELVFVAPIQNETADLDGPKILRAMMVRRMADRGYFPVATGAVDVLLAREHLDDPGIFARQPPGAIGPVIGAEAILYLNLKDWSSKFLGVTSSVAVEAEAILIDTRSGLRLWEGHARATDIPHANGGESPLAFLVNAAATAALHSALAPYRPLAEQVCSRLAAELPPGPRHSVYNDEE